MHASRFLTAVQDAKSRIEETTIAEVKARLDRGEPVLLVDVREESEWERGHIPGASYLGKGVIERDIERAVPNTDQEMILYCGGGYRSALAADMLSRMGYTKAISLDGGIKAWIDAGLPLVQD